MKYDKNNSPFVILGVDEKCTDDDVKKAYRRMVMRWHPDRSELPDAATQFKRIQVAYQLLQTESGRSMVRNVIKMSTRRGFKPPPFNKGYSPPGQKEFDPDYYSSTGGFRQEGTRSLVYAIVYGFFLEIFLLMRLDRWPMNMCATIFAALVIFNKFSPDAINAKIFGSMLLLGAIAGAGSDFMLNYAKMNSRYRTRMVVNNLVGYVSLFSITCFIWSIDYGGSAWLPSRIGLDADTMRDILLFALLSCFYIWFVFCFLFQKHHKFYETILVWLWVFSLEYFIIIEVGL